MVHNTRSTNPDIVSPDFTARVTPPRPRRPSFLNSILIPRPTVSPASSPDSAAFQYFIDNSNIDLPFIMLGIAEINPKKLRVYPSFLKTSIPPKALPSQRLLPFQANHPNVPLTL
ncbi:hypothetical protein PCANC_13123 [Puccinia coronata f. sp. avenae]|uniref:Uncharacterized protein n=1 Tax=Puccinia coronata f. sp. avenae TaxID=200324 RepID=A0A2N5UWC8_9BASI|nr:hypothetical protein PCANC_13123 [Puccinia coronata f. sp. avenae]